MARVRHGRRRLCGFCALPAACKRRSSRFTKFHGSDIDWHRHHGSQRRSWTPLDRDPSSETGFSVQALLALLYGVLHAGGGGFSWCSRFTPLSISEQWAGESFALVFAVFFLRSMGYLAPTSTSPSQRTGICGSDPSADHNSPFSRSASFL